jgi:hypothetical protein
MLKPSGGFFKKMFNPGNIIGKAHNLTKKAVTAPVKAMTRTPMTGAKPNKMASGGGPFNKAAARKVV